MRRLPAILLLLALAACAPPLTTGQARATAVVWRLLALGAPQPNTPTHRRHRRRLRPTRHARRCRARRRRPSGPPRRRGRRCRRRRQRAAPLRHQRDRPAAWEEHRHAPGGVARWARRGGLDKLGWAPPRQRRRWAGVCAGAGGQRALGRGPDGDARAGERWRGRSRHRGDDLEHDRGRLGRWPWGGLGSGARAGGERWSQPEQLGPFAYQVLALHSDAAGGLHLLALTPDPHRLRSVERPTGQAVWQAPVDTPYDGEHFGGDLAVLNLAGGGVRRFIVARLAGGLGLVRSDDGQRWSPLPVELGRFMAEPNPDKVSVLAASRLYRRPGRRGLEPVQRGRGVCPGVDRRRRQLGARGARRAAPARRRLLR